MAARFPTGDPCANGWAAAVVVAAGVAAAFRPLWPRFRVLIAELHARYTDCGGFPGILTGLACEKLDRQRKRWENCFGHVLPVQGGIASSFLRGLGDCCSSPGSAGQGRACECCATGLQSNSIRAERAAHTTATSLGARHGVRKEVVLSRSRLRVKHCELITCSRTLVT